MSMFKPHLSLRVHEAAHAVACVALGLPVEIVSTEIMEVQGHVKHKDIPLPLIVSRFIRLAGPIGQQMFTPESIKDRLFKGRLFAQPHLSDPTFYATCQARLNGLGWLRDLDECYQAILSKRETACTAVAELASIEDDVRAFFSAPIVRDSVLSIAETLGSVCRFCDERLAELNARTSELTPFVPARIKDACAGAVSPASAT